MNPWIILGLAILAEVTATTSLRLSEGFTRLVPSLLVILGYGSSFWLMSLILSRLSVGLTYAVWSGVGTAIVAVIGAILFKESLEPLKLLGFALIIAGVVVLNLVSRTAH